MQCNWSRKQKDAGYLINDAVKTGFKRQGTVYATEKQGKTKRGQALKIKC